MARPKKHELEVRREEVKVRYTLLELEHLQEQANAACLPRATFIRQRSLSERITVPQLRGIDPAVIVELNRLSHEMNAIGVNVNQIARAINSDRRFPPGVEHIASAFDALKNRTEAALERLVLSDGA